MEHAHTLSPTLVACKQPGALVQPRGGTSAASFQGKRGREADLHGVIAVRVGGVQLHGVQDLEHPATVAPS